MTTITSRASGDANKTYGDNDFEEQYFISRKWNLFSGMSHGVVVSGVFRG